MSKEIKLNPEQKSLFLNTLNKKGFLLEEKTQRTIDTLGYNFLQKNRIFTHKGERREIDLISYWKNRVFLIKCKKSDYDFVFTQNSKQINTLNIIYDSAKGMCIKHITKQNDFIVTWSEIAVMFEGNNPKIKNKKEEVAESSHNLIHKIIKQSLIETEAFICNERALHESIFTIVVTNARLLHLNFKEENINKSADLVNYESLKEVPYIVINFPEILFWGQSQQVLKSRNSDFDTHDHIKSIFFVNINHLPKLINKLCEEKYLPEEI